MAFEDLAEGEYSVSVNCEESRISCYAGKEFSEINYEIHFMGVLVIVCKKSLPIFCKLELLAFVATGEIFENFC